MFDIGFWELSVITIVALLVIGPERLPGVARTAGLWLGKIRGFVTSVKADIDKELQAEELKKILDRQAQSTGLHEILDETEQSLNKMQQDYLVKSPDNDDALRQELELMSSGSGLEEENPARQAAASSPARAFDHHHSPQGEDADAPPADAASPSAPSDKRTQDHDGSAKPQQ